VHGSPAVANPELPMKRARWIEGSAGMAEFAGLENDGVEQE